MPNYIVLRLVPPTAVDAATFTGYLNNLTINVYDISYNQPTNGVFIGSAALTPPPFPPALGTQIVQHSTPPFYILPLESVATALIEYPGGVPEYVGPNLRVELLQGAQTMAVPQLYYSVSLTNIPLPFPSGATMQGIADDQVSAFVLLPPPTQLMTMPADGSPPNFDDLLAAVTTVLAADPGLVATPAVLSQLTPAQCTNIAKEIIYGPQAPLPVPPETLGNMFTDPPDTGGFGDPHEQNLQQFEGQLTAYYATRDAQATTLANYIYALATAEWLELQTQAATQALVTFPVNPNAPTPPPLATQPEAQVLFTNVPVNELDVPAEYFYALTCNLPTNLSPTSRQTLIYGTDPQTNLNTLAAAIDAGWITLQLRNPAQAVRILAALNIPAAVANLAAWPLGPAPNPPATQIFVTDWLVYPSTAAWPAYTAGPDTAFWQAEAAAQPADFLLLVLIALTQGYPIGLGYLATLIQANLNGGLANVGQIENATPADWENFFNVTLPGLAIPTATALPPFTLPGTVAARIAAFIAYVQQFFAMGTDPVVLQAIPPDVLPRFGVPSYDLIAQTIADYPGFAFGMVINPATLEAAANAAALGDERAAAWAFQTIEALNELFILSQIPGATAAFDFSVMEALFARGFTSREQVLDLPPDDFQQALTGTIAYDHAAQIYANAGPAPVFPPPGGTPFGPINPGCLTDCIPPLEFSPLGPVAYLHEMLQLSERSSCEHPFAPPAPLHTTLQAQIDARRGPVEQLIVSEANLETPLPLIDMVNECLQFMAVTSPPTAHGTIYDTTEHELAGYKLCDDRCNDGPEHHDCGCEPHECGCHGDRHEHPECHEPARIFDALPEYSTPATPVPPHPGASPPLPGNTNVVPAVWEKLKSDFSACCLPYNQALDVNRTYLDYFRSCRFEEMRTFRRCITELVLDPAGEPADFQRYLYRYPARMDIAIEYLGLSEEEFTDLFGGVLPGPCCSETVRRPVGTAVISPIAAFEACLGLNERDRDRICLPSFLKCTCLTYCEFYELWKSGFVPFHNTGARDGKFPECEPCCLDDLCLRFPEGAPIAVWLHKLMVFIRLWRKLRHHCGADYTFVQLADICTVLELLNPDFIRRLAAFQMLRDQFRLPLTGREHPPAGATGADRNFLLALWVGPGAARWQWAVHRLLEGIAYHAKCRHECDERAPEFVKLLEGNLDPLSLLCGFDPANPAYTWHAWPQHTLRFAEILSKIYASNFSVGEVLYLFTADTHLDGEDPFPLQDANEADDWPLGLPDDERRVSLAHLRHKLLEVHTSDEDAERWTWSRIAGSLEHEFGFPDTVVTEFGAHFFPQILQASGVPVAPGASRFTSPPTPTNPAMWNAPPHGPFHYDTATGELWAVLPIRDAAVLAQLERVQALNPAERQAVQDVYFGPRQILSDFALLFEDFDEVQRRLIEGEDSDERWRYFQHRFAGAHARCGVIAVHLAEHVEAATAQQHPEGRETAHLVLKNLFADENAAAAWENDNGTVPSVTWEFTPAAPGYGGAYGALLGLAGTGLDGEFTVRSGGPIVWREIRDSLRPFGEVPDRENCPVPTVIPSMGLTLTPSQMAHVNVRNGLAMGDVSGEWLGGAQGFEARWHGVLMIDGDGEYHFHAGAPTEGEREHEHGHEEVRHCSWHVVLKRGQKTWVLLRHRWHHEPNLDPAGLHLDHGAYELTVEFVQHAPEYLHEDVVRHQHTGFEIKYRGPDTDDRLMAIPPTRLFRRFKDGPLDVPGLAGTPAAFLRQRYDSSLRDIRRTYQRAFKALLFAHRFALSARRHAGEGSELGYMLSEAARFSGWSYYWNGVAFTSHRADFNFNFLPIGDSYFSPLGDERANPSPKRVAALFDWWERIFDYTRIRQEVQADCGRRLWLLWAEARDQNPAQPETLLRHMGADAQHWPLDLHFFQDQTAPIYAVTTQDLEDDRWTVRAWHADRWLRRLWEHFTVKDITRARPALWASDDPALPVGGGAETGNANLLRFLCDGCFDNGAPRRYDDVRRLNDGLRERGRDALICYLCGPQGIAKSPDELSAILLLDVLAGRCEKASRIEEAISAVQTFIRRARIGLEPTWTITGAFAHLWDCRFISYRVWQACKRRELYKENWVDWDELEKAKKIEAFAFLDEQLKRATLTIAEPGGVDFWPDHLPPSHPALCLLQRRDPAEMQLLPAPREGLDLLATPERDARPSWITMVPEPQSPAPPPGALAPPPVGPPPVPAPKLPFWMECAIRLGTRFIRLAAAAYPPASTAFAPRHECHPKDPAKDKECCVTCCEECGCEHPAHVDEYYFWLIDAKFYTPEAQAVYSSIFDAEQNDYYDQNMQVSPPWHDPTQLPGLLAWPSNPMVRLAWCRVHNGEFQQPRRSVWGIPYDPTSGVTPDIAFLGRVGDSLYFDITPAGTDGFRYDMVPDEAVALENIVVPPAPPPPPPPVPLPAYPYFVYFEPGARLFPWSLFSPSIAVAHALRSHCRFEAALKWYDLVYDPLYRDNRWALCEPPVPPLSPPPPPSPPVIQELPAAVVLSPPMDPGCCCDTTDVTCREARDRSLLLHYLDTLLEWGDALMRRKSPEAFEQARVIFDVMRRIMGRHPRIVKNPLHPHETVATFKPLWAPINPRLITLYDQLDDRLDLVHECMTMRRLVEMPRKTDSQYWDDDPVRGGWRTTLLHACCDTDGLCRPCYPYRFTFRIEKAKELAAQTRELGDALLAAFEKGDAEFLASVRARQEHELAQLNRRVREDVWRDGDWQVQALEQQKLVEQSNRRYYANLIANGLNAHEQGYVGQTDAALGDRTAANAMEIVAEGMDVIPDLFVGTDDFTWLPLGTKLSGLFKTIARFMNTLGDIASTTAALDLTEAGWDRRLQDWNQQVAVLDLQIHGTELQILGAERRRNQSLRELNIQERTIEQAKEVLDLMRDKFTNHALYLFLQKHTADLYRRMFDLAMTEAHEAQRAFNFERGHTTNEFVGRRQWDNLHEGLLAGDRLQLELTQMEKAYYDHNCREYELTKHISLRLCFPLEFLRLKLTGRCEIELPEWMFDLDYPGQFMRRIKTVSLTIPCVAGPYNEVHCRLTLLRSGTRIDPLPRLPAAQCCDCCQSRNGYPVCPHDPRWVSQNGALEAIATSTGIDDAGLFQVNFADDRYLPFEFQGAVSRWRIEMPHENNYFDMESLSDVVLNLSYSSREGGEALRRAARDACACDLPGAGWCLFDLRHDFADAWELFRRDNHEHRERRFDLHFSRHLFPFVPGDRELFIETMAVLFDRPDHCGCECPQECPCCSDPEWAHRELVLHSREGERRFECVASADWPRLYHGVVSGLCLGPVGRRERERERVTLGFPPAPWPIDAVYLLCRYSLQDKCCTTHRPERHDRDHDRGEPPHRRVGRPDPMHRIGPPHREVLLPAR